MNGPLAFALPLILQVTCLAQEVEPDTMVAPTDFAAYSLGGEWTRRTDMWPDAALLFREQGRDLLVLDGGAKEPRLVWDFPHNAWSRMSGAAWSHDGTVFYCWLDFEQQLVAIHRDSGEPRSLTSFPTHAWNLKGDQHLIEQPAWRRRGQVENGHGRLLFILDAEFNDEMAFWQRGIERGGSSLVSLDPKSGAITTLVPKTLMPATILSWDLSVSRSRVYLVSKPRSKYRPGEPHALEERGLDGAVTRAFVEPEGGAGDIALSPDENVLLVERRHKPGMSKPAGDFDAFSFEDHKALRLVSDGGFVLIDLDSGAVVDGPRSGDEAAWCPDNRRIAWVDEWDVNVYDRTTNSATRLVSGGRSAEDNSYDTWVDAAWSPDGKRLALATWARSYALLLDLEQKEYFVLDRDAQDATWCTVPQPFAADRVPRSWR